MISATLGLNALSQGFNEPSGSLKGYIAPERLLNVSMGTFRAALFHLNASVPLLTRYEINNKSGSFTIRVNLSLRRRNYEWSEWNSNRPLYYARFGLNAIYHLEKNKLGDNMKYRHIR